MKKILLAFLFIGFVSASNAQDRVSIGLKAGFNSTKINTSNVPSSDLVKAEAKSGYLFGAYGRVKLIGSVSFQPEFYYTKKQSGLVVNGVNEGGDIKTWDLPLLANFQLLDVKVLQLYGVAGPVASFISSSDIKNIENTNWTFQAGLGAQVWKFSADVRYEWGMTDISKAQSGQKTDVLTVTVGYRLFGF